MSEPSVTHPAEPGPDSIPPTPILQNMVMHEKGAESISNSEAQRHAASDADTGGARRKWTTVRWIIVIVAILSSTFLYALDNTITANIRPSMIAALGNRIDMLPWLSVSYPMGEVGTNPLWGKLNKYFNNKLLYLIADSAATWRWAFYINICIAGFAIPACIVLIPSISPSAAPLWDRVKRVDYIGATLFIGGVVTVVMILGFGSALYPWASDQMIGLYVAAPVLWAAFMQFIGDLEMAAFFCWGSLAIANVVVTVYSLPLFFQFTYGDSSLHSAAYTIPFVCACVAVGGIAGPIITKYPLYMAWFAGASMLMLIGNGLLTTIHYETSRAAVCGYTIISGAGCGPIMQLGYTAAQSKVARRNSSAWHFPR
ncbi:hypothetical protein MFIFM68171_03006 [Madurella fahalii]|uniref:MFS general substrate transporter n=1 Tax=Madurella fahalii TaxID=1157608 RepID=A0ABQ0G4V0_9PEZI